MSFTDLDLIDPLLRALDMLDYRVPSPVQAQAIPGALAGRDLVVAAQTGTGKTAAFALPTLQRLACEETPVGPGEVRVLVLVPTRELAEQVFNSYCDYGHFLPLRGLAAYGGVSIGPQLRYLREGSDLLVATPGRLLDLFQQRAFHFGEVRTLVLDEADRMFDLGFARELETVFAALRHPHQTLLFSATFSAEVRALAARLLDAPLQIDASPRNTAVSSVKQSLVTVDKKRKTELFCHLLKKHRWEQVLVFVRTKKGVNTLLETLAYQGFAADAIHGDKPQPIRQRALDRFKQGEVSILVATDVAARGLDIDELPLVVNFDLPTVAEDYVHRIGRTGRAGASGTALSLVCADEAPMLRAIEQLIQQTIRRREERGFSPEHRVPQTAPEGQQARPARSSVSKPRPASSATGKRPAKASARPQKSGRKTSGRAR